MILGLVGCRAFVRLCACVAAIVLVSGAKAPALQDPTQGYTRALQATAAALDIAAHGQTHGAAVPAMHVPPAPRPGPPRFSPSLDDWLQAALGHARAQRSANTRAEELRELASTLRQVAGAASATQAGPRLDAAATARAVLADPAYRENGSGKTAKPQKTLWDRFVEWLAGLFDKLFSGLFSAASASPLFGKTLAILLIITFVSLLGVVAYRLARAFLVRRRRGVAAEEGETIEIRPDPSSLYGQARVAARNGQYGRAIALVFRASLMLLDRAGRIPYDPARTAGEYRGEVRRHIAAAAAPFDSLARLFTLATYADSPVSGDDWSQAEDDFSRFEPLVERR